MNNQKQKHKRNNGKSKNIKDRLDHRDIYGITSKWTKWAKRYLNKATRRERYEED